jgi:hypothetical protein
VFLDLMSSITFFVPTIVSVPEYHFGDAPCNLLISSLICHTTQNIDFSWRTHQLKSKQYREQILRYVGRTPDHEGNVEEGALSMGYEITVKAWESCFGVPYLLWMRTNVLCNEDALKVPGPAPL